MNRRTAGFSIAALAFAALPALAQAQPITERLSSNPPTSTFTRQDCLGPCACVAPPYTAPATGAFTLTLNHQDTFTRYYDVTAANIAASPVGPGGIYNVTYTGVGTYQIGGDFAYTHRLILDLTPNATTVIHHFDSGYLLVSSAHPFPQISINLTTGVLGCTQYSLHIDAAPAPTSTCPADFDSSGTLTIDDVFAFLNAWLSGDPRADFNGGGLSTQDIFDFLNAWFAGCP